MSHSRAVQISSERSLRNPPISSVQLVGFRKLRFYALLRTVLLCQCRSPNQRRAPPRHGFSIVQAAIPEQELLTLETANATLPKFQEALQLLADTGEYAASVNVDFAQLVENVGTYIEIQEAIIRRGRGLTGV